MFKDIIPFQKFVLYQLMQKLKKKKGKKEKKEMRFIDGSTHQGFGHYNFNFLFSLNSKFRKEALDDIFTRLDIGVNRDV